MSTRSNIIVDDGIKRIQLYRHMDGHPEHVISELGEVFVFAWALPRFEADDFAAAIIRAWKELDGGNIYIDGSPKDWELLHGDIDYLYVIKPPLQSEPITPPIVEVYDYIPSPGDKSKPLFVVNIGEYNKQNEL